MLSRSHLGWVLLVAALGTTACASGIKNETGAGGDGSGGAATTATTGTTSSTGAGGHVATGGAGTGGSGGVGGCYKAVDCPPPTSPCVEAVCINAECKTQPANEQQACDDGDVCTDGERCAQGLCTGGTPKLCGSPDSCHVGVCDPASQGCVVKPGNDGASCDDNDPCTQSGVCSAGVCSKGAPVDCSFFDGPCTKGVCVANMGCQPLPLNDGSPCPDGLNDPCSNGQCQQGNCTPVQVPNGTACDDFLFCTINDVCTGGVCGGAPNPCAPPGGCLIAQCDEITASCITMPGNDGAVCNDGDVCNANKHCAAGACTGGNPINDGMACDDLNSCTMSTTCTAGVCTNGTGPKVYFADDFHDNSKGWQLGPEWQIGSATASVGQSYGNPDPSQDHTATGDNGVAGVAIGGNEITAATHAAYYLTSPPFDTSAAAGPVFLGFYRFLNSDYDPFMHNMVEVFDGVSWVQVWITGSSPGVTDAAWTYQSFDLTAYKNAQMQVRFGFDIGSVGVFTVSSWNVDDVLVADAMCP